MLPALEAPVTRVGGKAGFSVNPRRFAVAAVLSPFPGRQQGQAMIYLLALLPVLMFAGLYAFNASRLSTERMALQNAADAVAFSAATIEARHLNALAYTNRAMVANQVAIAQAVSLLSWSRWLDSTAQTAALMLKPVPGLNVLAESFAQLSRQSQPVVEGIADAVLLAHDTMLTILEKTQWALDAGTSEAILSVTGQVAAGHDRAIDPVFKGSRLALLMAFERAHNDFLRRFAPAPVRDKGPDWRQHQLKMDQFRSITMASRDGFSRWRTYVLLDPPALGWWDFDLTRTGGTDLVGVTPDAPYDGWIALDTLAAGVRTRGCGRFGFGWCKRKEMAFSLPESMQQQWGALSNIGAGAARTSRPGTELDYFEHRGNEAVGRSWRINPRTARAAALSFADDQMRSTGGLRPFYDLQLGGLLSRGPGIQVLLSRPGTVRKSGKSPVRPLYAIAAAEPWFARGQDSAQGNTDLLRLDGAREFGNLFSPYWQPRLRSLSALEKLQLRGLVL